MADIKISDLTALTTPASGDILIINDVSEALPADQTKKITLASLFAWTAYTPTWTAATTNPDIGNGTLAGRYCLVGKKCDVAVLLTTGATTTYGTGAWSFALPATAANLVVSYVGSFVARDTGTTNYAGSCRVNAGNSAISTFNLNSVAVTNLTSAAPMTWASGDQLFFTVTYEVA